MDDISHPIFSYHPSECLGCMPLVCLWNIPCTQDLTLHFLGNPVAGCPWQACPGRLPLNETISKFYSNLNRAAGTISSCGGTACCPSESWQTGRIRFCNISFGDQVAKPEQVFGDSLPIQAEQDAYPEKKERPELQSVDVQRYLCFLPHYPCLHYVGAIHLG